MLESGKRFDLSAFPFSGRDAHFAIREDEKSRELFLYFHRSTQPVTERESGLRIVPVIDNKEDVRWSYTVDGGVLTLKSTKGETQFCFQRGNLLRIYGNNISLRLICDDVRIYENAAPREDGSLEMSFEILGKYLLEPLRGVLWHNAKWNHELIRTKEYMVELMPDSTGVFDMALHEYYTNGEADEHYPPFDEVKKTATSALQSFAEQLSAQTELEKTAAYALDCLHMSKGGHMAAGGFYAAKKGYTLSVGWQQAIAAAAFSGNASLAYETLMAPFAKQDASGQIPNAVNYTWTDFVTTGAPFQGFAVCHLLDNGVMFTKAQAVAMYAALKAYAEWFRRERCVDGLHPRYYHPEECGFLDATIFKWGVPVRSADLYALLALMFEACARLAQIAGIQDDGMDTSKTLIDNMASLWKKGRFLCENTRTGRVFASDSILTMLPIILGNRLDKDICNALIDDLFDSDTFRAEGGLLSERLSSKEFSLNQNTQLQGGINTAVQFMIASGLKHAGRSDLARELAGDVLKTAEKWGLLNTLPPFANDLWDGNTLQAENRWHADELALRKNLLRDVNKEPKSAFVWGAAAAASILGLSILTRG